jgi:hypothetical protein
MGENSEIITNVTYLVYSSCYLFYTPDVMTMIMMMMVMSWLCYYYTTGVHCLYFYLQTHGIIFSKKNTKKHEDHV